MRENERAGGRGGASAGKARIIVLGTRGIPSIQGGIETHVRMLYPLVARLGCDVEVIQRAPYFPRATRKAQWHGVRLTYLWAPKVKAVETAWHTFLGILYAAARRPALLHLHGIGPAFLTPLARLLGLRVVVTHHTFDYRREKWGKVARAIFNLGESLGMKYANGRIAVSEDIRNHVHKAYGVDAALIPNGAPAARKAPTTGALERFGLAPGQYVLCVARLESTKRHVDLIDAFERAALPGWKLALVGGLEHNDRYVRMLVERARGNRDIVLTDFQSGRALRELYSHAALFVLCSSHEGQPIALLEALSYGLPVLATAIPANLSVPLPAERFFAVGDVAKLAELIAADAANGHSPSAWRATRDEVRRRFDWKVSARRTQQLYANVIAARG